MIRAGLCAALVLAGTVVQAGSLRDCETWEANARNVNWADPTRVYANGDIRLIALDTAEPVCCWAHLMVLHPEPDEPFLKCTLVSNDDGHGWAGMSLSGATAAYDPNAGLRISIPVALYADNGTRPSVLDLVVNQSTGQVTFAE